VWFIFALLSALFISMRKVPEKRLTHKIHYFTYGWALQLFALPVVLAAWLLAGEFFNPFTLGPNFWLPLIIIWFGFCPLSSFLYISALKHGELSKILPLQSLGPIFALVLAWPLLHQLPSLTAFAGIVIVVLGVYVLNLKGRYLHNPLGIFKGDKANLYMVLNLVLIAIAGVLSAIAIKASEPLFFGLMNTLGAIPVLYACALLFKVKELTEVKRHIRPLLISGGLFGASQLTHMIALSLGPLAYVSAVRGSSAVMGAVLGIMYLRESVTIPKVVALSLITVGSIIVGLHQ